MILSPDMKDTSYLYFDEGDIVMKQGESGKNAYIIEEGRVEILLERENGKVQHLGFRGKGNIVGEMAIVDDSPRTATVRAVEPCKMLVITRENFAHRLNNLDPVLQLVMRVILIRYRDTITRAEILKDPEAFPPPEELEKKYLDSSDAIEAIKMANAFQYALNNNELSLYYQPVIDLESKRPVSFEALMRWQDKQGEFIRPDVFIPVAEESGLILQASRWAVEEVCGTIRNNKALDVFAEASRVSINFSEIDFMNPGFFDFLKSKIKEYKLKPHNVTIEITESILMKHPEKAKETLKACRKAGFGIAIDDFGTGYSSLSYLHYFPIDTLKIDKSFIRQMMKDRNSMELVKSIISLGKNLNMKVIAEGVETGEEESRLVALGCDMAQGYYYARPMPQDELEGYLENL